MQRSKHWPAEASLHWQNTEPSNAWSCVLAILIEILRQLKPRVYLHIVCVICYAQNCPAHVSAHIATLMFVYMFEPDLYLYPPLTLTNLLVLDR